MMEGIAARSSIAVPNGRLSHTGESSVRNSAMPKLTGTPISIAMNEVTSVPKIGTSAPNRSWTGSQSEVQMNRRPYFSRVSALPIASETRIAARMPNTKNAKNRVSHSKATSTHLAGRMRDGGGPRLLISIGFSRVLSTVPGRVMTLIGAPSILQALNAWTDRRERGRFRHRPLSLGRGPKPAARHDQYTALPDSSLILDFHSA